MANFNKVLLMGNLTRDPEVRTTQGGTQVAKFGMAVNRKFTANGQTQEQTCFVDCTAFGRQAEVLAQYMRKGRGLFIEGRLEYQTWTDQQGGKRSKHEVIVENFQFLGQGQGQGQGQGGGGRQGAGAPDEGGFGNGGGFGYEAEGEIPF
ncbi:MAG: single-stranded DNA-binding protein [Planctomycetota bacterium]